MTPLVSIQNPGPENVQEVRERGLASFSFLKKTESQAWGRNGLKKKQSPKVLGLCFFSNHFSPMPGTLFFSEHYNYRALHLTGPPPKLSKYKIPLYPQALREFSEQLTWDLVLRNFRGGPVKRSAL